MKLPSFICIWLRLALISLAIGLVFVGPSRALPSQRSPARWQQLGLIDDNVTGVVTPANNGNVAYVSTRGYRHGVFRTVNLGNTWEPKNTGLDVLDFRFLLLGDPQTDNLVYAVADLSLWKTVNRGESWTNAGLPWPAAFDNRRGCGHALHQVASNRVVYASMHQVWTCSMFWCSCSKYWLTKSTNAGNSWSDVSVPSLPTSALAVSPSNSAIVYAANGANVFLTQDGGQNWMPLAGVGRNYALTAITIHPQNPDLAYAITQKNGIYRTSNAGQSWDSLNTTLPTQGDDLKCRALTVHPTEPDIVFLACDTYGVFWSRNGGNTWEERNEGFNFYLQIHSLAIAPLGTGVTSRPARHELDQAFSHKSYLPVVMRSELPPLPPFVVYMGTEAGVWRLIGP